MSDVEDFSSFLARQLDVDEPDYPRLVARGEAYRAAARSLLEQPDQDEELAAKALYLLYEIDPTEALPYLLDAVERGGPTLQATAVAGLTRVVNHVREQRGLLGRTFKPDEVGRLMRDGGHAMTTALRRLATVGLRHSEAGVQRAALRGLYRALSAQHLTRQLTLEEQNRYSYTMSTDDGRVIADPPHALHDRIEFATNLAKRIDVE